MKVALLSCTSKKKSYKCGASEMYSESPRFALAYKYAKMTCDAVYVLSAKYGLISEDMEIEPYDETLKDKSTNERREWSEKVLHDLNNISSLQNDEFLVLAGVAYNEYLLHHLKKYELPLKGESLGNWIPKLRMLIDNPIPDNNNACEEIHILFNNMQRMAWSDIKALSFDNGIYVVFENGEKYADMDRIVRVGTHKADGRLKKRLKDHFIKENKDGSIFRKNIGRALLHLNKDSYENTWELNTSKPEIKEAYSNSINMDYQKEIENRVTTYMRGKFSFVCFQVDTKDERLRLEEGLIAFLNQNPDFRSSSSWMGLNSTVGCIVESGLWNSQGLKGTPLTREEFAWIKKLVNREASKGESSGSCKNIEKTSEKKPKVVDCSTDYKKTSTNQIRNYIDEKLKRALKDGEEYLDVISGDIHRDMNLKNYMPSVCGAMYQLKSEMDEVLSTTPSGKSSTIKIRYYLKK